MSQEYMQWGIGALVAYFTIKETFKLINSIITKLMAKRGSESAEVPVPKVDCHSIRKQRDEARDRMGKNLDKVEDKQEKLSEKVNGHDSTLKGLEVGMSFLVKQHNASYEQLKQNGGQ